MLILDYKVRANPAQQSAIDEAIRVTQFIRNKCIRLWMDTRGTTGYDLNQYSAQVAKEYPFAARLNSMARQVAAERGWLKEESHSVYGFGSVKAWTCQE